MLGLLLSLLSMGRIIFAVPGTVLIVPYRHPYLATGRKDGGLVALVGPVANIALVAMFLFLTYVGGFLSFMAV